MNARGYKKGKEILTARAFFLSFKKRIVKKNPVMKRKDFIYYYNLFYYPGFLKVPNLIKRK